MYEARLDRRTAKDRWVLPGAVMGVAAGMVFITFQMVAAALVGADFLAPLIAVGNAVLGWESFGGYRSPELAALAGLPVHAAVCAVLGAAFGALGAVGPVRRSNGALLLAGTAFGLLLWAPGSILVSWGIIPRFPASYPVVQLLAYGAFFGPALALMLGVRLRSEASASKRVAGRGIPAFREDDDKPEGGC